MLAMPWLAATPFCGEVSYEITARNVLKGKVKKIADGVVNTEVVVELPGGQEIVLIITKSSSQSLVLRWARMSTPSSRRVV